MRKRIRQLARGQFEYERPEVVLPDTLLQFAVMVNQDYQGSFRVKSENGVAVRGMVYSTMSRMEVLTSSIEGCDCEVRFVCHGKGLPEGAEISGELQLICNGFTKKIPYQGIVTAHAYESSIGSIKNPSDFARLAQDNWQEAYRLFYHPAFSSLLSGSSRRVRMIYRGMMDVPASEQNLEEFLVGCDLKKHVLFQTEDSDLLLETNAEDMTGHLDLIKDGWGYLGIRAECREDFLTLEKKEYTTEDFMGNGCRVNFTISADRLHCGINRARITFTSCYQKQEVIVTVRGRKVRKPSEQAMVRREMGRLLALYRNWRVREITTADWARDSLDTLEKLEILNPAEALWQLIRIYIQIQNRQRKTAENLLAVFEDVQRDNKDTGVMIFYAYLRYLLQKDQAGRERYAEQIETLYLRETDRNLVFYIWYLLQKISCNEEELYERLRSRMAAGNNSVFIYAEYYSLLTQKPDLIGALDKTDLRVLVWAMRRSTITENVAEKVMILADKSKEARLKILPMLEKIYEQHPDKYYLSVICRYLIQARRFAPEYLPWYEKGIEQEVRITGLYEAYLQSLDEEEEHQLPKILQMYFQYDSQLPYQKMAVLYRNIIDGKSREGALYQKYLKNMSHFALEQAEEEHMSSNLAGIYKEMLPPDVMNERLAESMAKILFTCKVTVPEDDLVNVIVYQWEMKNPQEVMVADHTAYVNIYGSDYVILLEDTRGRRFVSSRKMSVEHLMDPEKYLDVCMKLAPEELPYILLALETRTTRQALEALDERCFDRFLLREDVSAACKAQYEPEILSYYEERGLGDRLKRYLTAADFSVLSGEARRTFTGLMVSGELYDYAYEVMKDYGPQVLEAQQRVTVLADAAQKLEGEADDQLLGLMIETFREGKYDREMIDYLCRFYAGPAKTMTAVWNAAGRFGLKIAPLEERILVTVLYTEDDLTQIFPVFLHYYKNNGRELILQAYLSACSQKYFVDGCPMNEALFEILQKRHSGGRELNDACKLALLRHLASLDNPDSQQMAVCDRLMEDFTNRNMFFAFYKDLDHRLQQKYHLSDKVFLEYRAKPDTRVTLHISKDEDGQEFRAEEMPEMYCGIYVKAFVLFFGEMVRYYITEENGNEVELQESSCLRPANRQKMEEGRYQMINQILMSRLLREDERMEEDMCAFHAHMEAQKKLFGLL